MTSCSSFSAHEPAKLRCCCDLTSCSSSVAREEVVDVGVGREEVVDVEVEHLADLEVECAGLFGSWYEFCPAPQCSHAGVLALVLGGVAAGPAVNEVEDAEVGVLEVDDAELGSSRASNEFLVLVGTKSATVMALGLGFLLLTTSKSS